jgi:hypothetical protein
MRRLFLVLTAVFVAVPFRVSTRADVRVGATITDEGLRSFHIAIGDYYNVPEREVIVVRERRIPDDELPVVFFLASRCHQEPSVIVNMRLSGDSWIDIAWHFGLGTDVFYVPLDRDPGPPYGRAYGHFKKTKRGNWGKIHLADADVVNLVNLRFISDHYRYSPYEVTKMRAKNSSFVRVAGDAKKGKSGKSVAAKGKDSKGKDAKGGDKKSKGKGKR